MTSGAIRFPGPVTSGSVRFSDFLKVLYARLQTNTHIALDITHLLSFRLEWTLSRRH